MKPFFQAALDATFGLKPPPQVSCRRQGRDALSRSPPFTSKTWGHFPGARACTGAAWRKRILAFLPILHWLPRYKGRNLVPDVIAGLTVGIMHIPQVSPN